MNAFRRLENIALAVLLALLFTAPFLYPVHLMPIPSFGSEWWALALGIALLALVLLTQRKAPPLALPFIAVAPALLLVAVLVQWALQRLPSPQLGLIYAAYLLFAVGLAVAGRTLAERWGLEALAKLLAGAVIGGGVLCAAVMLAQANGVVHAWIFPVADRARLYANLGQPNDMALYLLWGLAAVGYFYAGGLRKVGAGATALLAVLALILLFAAMATGSRIVPVYLLAAPVLVLVLRWLNRTPGRAAGDAAEAGNSVEDGAMGSAMGSATEDAAQVAQTAHTAESLRRWTRYTVALLPAALALHGLWRWWLGSGASPFERLVVTAGEAAAESTRLKEIGNGLDIALAHPWLGGGAGAYPWLGFFHGGAQRQYVSERAHNLPVDLLAEFGLVVGVLVCGWIGWRCLRMLRQATTPARAWAMFFCLATAIQALVQYPLHYAHFLGTVAFVLGAFDADARRVVVGRRLAAYALVLAAVAGSALFSAQRDYARLLDLSQRSFAYYTQEPAAWLLARNDLARMAGASFVAPWATRTLAAMMEPERERAADQSFLCQRVMRTGAPAPEFGTKCAVLLAMLGRQAEAADLVTRFAATFPASRPAMRAQLAAAAKRFPEVEPLRALILDDKGELAK